jgi:hypothetical protein
MEMGVSLAQFVMATVTLVMTVNVGAVQEKALYLALIVQEKVTGIALPALALAKRLVANAEGQAKKHARRARVPAVWTAKHAKGKEK